MLRLHGVIAKVCKDVIDLLVVLEVSHVSFVDLVASHLVGKVPHLLGLVLQSLLDGLVDIALERSGIYIIDRLPDSLDLKPDF